MRYLLVPVLALSLLLTGCKEDVAPVVTGVGELTLNVTKGDDSYQDRPLLKSSDDQNIDDFTIRIRKYMDEYGELLQNSVVWEYTVGTFPKVHEFAPGGYDIEVKSPSISHVSQESASYYAHETFTIIADKVTDLDVVCKVSNMKVSVAPTDNFFNQLSHYNITITAEYDDVDTPLSVVWTETDFTSEGTTDKVAYFDVAPLSIMVSGRRVIDGSDVSLEEPFVISSVKPMDHHIINVDVQLVGQLQSSISIMLDDKLNSYESDIVVGGFEEIPIPDEDEEDEEEQVLPYMIWSSNPDFQTSTIDENLDVTIDIYAPRKIKSFIVRVSENFVEFVQVLTAKDPATDKNYEYMDLINDQTLIDNLNSINIVLPHGDQLLGKDYVPFSLSSIVPMITTVVQDGYVTFTLELIDRDGNMLTQDLTFYSPKQ